jgi:hypothetical protein
LFRRDSMIRQAIFARSLRSAANSANRSGVVLILRRLIHGVHPQRVPSLRATVGSQNGVGHPIRTDRTSCRVHNRHPQTSGLAHHSWPRFHGNCGPCGLGGPPGPVSNGGCDFHKARTSPPRCDQPGHRRAVARRDIGVHIRTPITTSAVSTRERHFRQSGILASTPVSRTATVTPIPWLKGHTWSCTAHALNHHCSGRAAPAPPPRKHPNHKEHQSRCPPRRSPPSHPAATFYDGNHLRQGGVPTGLNTRTDRPATPWTQREQLRLRRRGRRGSSGPGRCLWGSTGVAGR